LIVVGVCMLGLGALSGSLLYRPAWYVPAVLDRSRLDQDNRDLVNLLDRIGVALNHGNAIDIDLDQDQVNRWIGARHEWPEAVQRLDLGPFGDPFVVFAGEGALRLGALARLSDVSVVVSGDLRIVVESDRVALTLSAARVGAVSLPRNLMGRVSRDIRTSSPEAAGLLRSGQTSWPNDWLWQNGKRRFRVGHCVIEAGLVRIRIEPLR
jgi:hypothetical protein